MEDTAARAHVAGQVKVWSEIQDWAKLRLARVQQYEDPRGYQEILAMARDRLMLLQGGAVDEPSNG